MAPSSQPPLRHGRSYHASGKKLNQAYDAWVEHWTACMECRQHDWYQPDECLLCGEGLVKFEAWGKAAFLDKMTKTDVGEKWPKRKYHRKKQWRRSGGH